MKLFPVVLICISIATCAVAQSAKDSDADDIEKEVIAVLDEFMASFNRMDMTAWERTFHFPHYRLASGGMRVLNRSGERTAEQVKRAIGNEWHHSKWNRKKIIHLSESKVHVDTRFTRYRKNGSVIASFDSLYILTKEDGRWGVKVRSSMAP